MCGIVGVQLLSGNINTKKIISDMTKTIKHRGPDHTGSFHNETIGLGHTRLAIHDLTKTGNQPMFSQSKNWVIVFNGEIYNYKKIKEKLCAKI